MKISDLDKSDKPREKAMRHGIGTLTNAELLAIVIGSGLPGQSVVELSQSMLLGSDNKLSALSRQSIGEMSRKHKGIGPAKAVSIAAAFELGRRCMAETPVEVLQIRTAADIDRYIRANTRLALIDYEEFWVLKITRSNRIKGASRVSSGGTAATVVDVKMVMKEAVDSLCDGMVLVHNHPSGNLNASPEDIKLTKRIKEACDLFGIRLIDHVIIGGNSYMSFRDRDIL
ncbi:MAG: DNA repair protein RadC [Bacteroides sp.]|nr:DNA repair protein RadC [Bacteroides sp.]MDE7471860.1 DNA repair protein RadC [Paramuribaculum sp.]